MSDIYIKAENLSKCFRILQRESTLLRAMKTFFRGESMTKELWALKDVSFGIKKGEKVAVIGKNGSGKTTLLRLISGIYGETSGCLEVSGIPATLFKCWIGFDLFLSVVDNVYLFGAIHGIDKRFLEMHMEEVITTAGLYHLRYVPLKDLSSGQMQRLAISIFFQASADFLIFDESFAFIDNDFADKCEKYFTGLHSSPRTVIIASHDLAFLKKHCDRALWFEKGVLRMDGGVQEVLASYERT